MQEERRQGYDELVKEVIQIRIDQAVFIEAMKPLTENVKALNHIITGSGDPKEGLPFKVASLEQSKKDRDGHFMALLSSFGLIFTGVVTDWVNRFFWHHK